MKQIDFWLKQVDTDLKEFPYCQLSIWCWNLQYNNIPIVLSKFFESTIKQ